MAYKAEYKTTFEPGRVIQPIYTGGSVALSQDGRILASCLGEDALLSDLATGEHLARIEGDGESITTLAMTPDAKYLVLCSRNLSMRIFSLRTSPTADRSIDATLLRTLKPHTAPVVVAAVDPTSTLLATGGADGIVKVWDIKGGFTTHTFHGHSGIISALHFFHVDTSATSAENKSRKRKSRSGDDDAADATAGYRLASGGEDGKVRIWDLHKRKPVATLDSHVSVVRSLDFSSERQLLLSASRDKTVITWDAKTWQSKLTAPILETVERAGFVANGDFFFTGGENARVRIWDMAGHERTEEQEPGVETEAILDIIHHSDLPFLLSVHVDQTLVLHSLEPLIQTNVDVTIPPLPIIRRISGTHDEIIDMAYVGTDNSMLALATNLEDIRLITLNTESKNEGSSIADAAYFGADVALLKGHTDIIITIDTDWSGHWLATGAKDNTAKLWRLDPANNSYNCYATFTGHAESISAVALPHAIPVVGSNAHSKPLEHPPTYLITGSQDKTIKRWDITSAKSGLEAKAVRATYTRKAHDKDINAIDTSYAQQGTLFASASQDRTVKIWDLETGESVGVLRGHKRGVWSVAFAPPGTPAIAGDSGSSSGTRGMAVTGSGDKTVKIWSLNDYSCLRTFEGHTNSILKVIWLPVSKNPGKRGERNLQVASAAGDGLVKVWDAQSGECAATLDNHIDRVWALAVKSNRSGTAKATSTEDDEEAPEPPVELISGSADATLTFWTDTTLMTSQASASRATARVEQDQELQNHIHAKNYREAIVLALQLNHPKRLLDLFTRVLESEDKDEDSLTGAKGVDEVLGSLSEEQLWKLLLRCRDWNANARTAHVSQRILYALFRLYPKEKFVQLRRKRAPKPPVADEDELAQGMGALEVKDKVKKNENVKDVLEGLKAYTERHYGRLEKMAEERWVLLWTLQQMDS
ncbi:small nucleolar ribonucleoprotein-like protein complex subunit, partial [Aureobasidium melanogenum]